MLTRTIWQRAPRVVVHLLTAVAITAIMIALASWAGWDVTAVVE